MNPDEQAFNEALIKLNANIATFGKYFDPHEVNEQLEDILLENNDDSYRFKVMQLERLISITDRKIEAKLEGLKRQLAEMQSEMQAETARNAELTRLTRQREPTRFLQPSATHPAYATYDFGVAMRNNTPFDSHFSRNDKSSMFLFVHLHGSLNLKSNGEPNVLRVSGVTLNKYSMSGTGKCNFSSKRYLQHMLNSVCDAIQTNKPIDIETILNETLIHKHAKSVGISEAKLIAPTMAVEQHKKGITRQAEVFAFSSANKQTQPHKSRLGETPYIDEVIDNNIHTYGETFVEKVYQIDKNDGPDESDGIYLCKDWDEIGASCMDNLMTNRIFIGFICNKYRDKYLKKLILTYSLEEERVACMGEIKLSDLLEFCYAYSRPNVSIVDSSCSEFTSSTGRTLTVRGIANANKKAQNLDPTTAKGTKKRQKKVKVKVKRTRGNKRR